MIAFARLGGRDKLQARLFGGVLHGAEVVISPTTSRLSFPYVVEGEKVDPAAPASRFVVYERVGPDVFVSAGIEERRT